MNDKMVEKDERTIFIENKSYSYGYKFLSIALLLDVMYRSLMLNEAPWDLLVLIMVSGFIMTAYQYKQKILGQKWLKITVIALAVAMVAALITAIITLKVKF